MRKSTYLLPALIGLLALTAAFAFKSGVFDRVGDASAGVPVLEGSRDEAERFMANHRSIHLTPAQEAIRQEALGAIPAPCCSDFSIATCCCECNLARAVWGLSKFLIAEKGLGTEQVRETVEAWLQAIHPAEYTGDACFTGGCGRGLREGACGGMDEHQLLF
jgi:hypothetical protein